MKNWKQLPFVTITIVALNLLIHIAGSFGIGDLYWKGMLDPYRILAAKEYGRIISSMFLHANVNHLFSNMMCILFVGIIVENELGHISLGALYFFSGICGNLMSLYFKVLTGSTVPSLGASGAAFGLDGALLAIIFFSGRKVDGGYIQRVLVSVLLSLYSGYAAGNVDNEAHLGGLIGGFVLGMIICLIQRAIRQKKRKRYIGR